MSGVKRYPRVVGEFATLEQLQDGKSIARFGDGELKLMTGMDQMREPRNERLGQELRSVLQYPPDGLLVGIPTMDDKGPKYLNWTRHKLRFQSLLSKDVKYNSAFISRPDSAPWIRCRGYAEHFEKIWKGKRVALVAEEGTAIHRLVRKTARFLELFVCPHTETYRHIDKLERSVNAYSPDIALLSCGPAATCLAARLVPHMQAIDIGSAGGFLVRELYGIDAGSEDEDKTKE